MITFMIVFALILSLMAKRILKKGAVMNMQAKPYRYQVESRRSPWSHRTGF